MKDNAPTTMSVETFSPDPHHIGARIRGPKARSFTIHTESNHSLDTSATPWLSAVLPVAMQVKTPVDFDGDVDSVAIDNSHRAQEILSGWHPRHYPRTTIGFRETLTSVSPAPGVGCFFSCGVDSFYTAINQSDRITHLVFVHGYDIKPDDHDLAAQALASARAAAGELGKPLIEVRTTLRAEFSDSYRVPWGHIYHGAALAHVAQALSPHLGTVIIPSSYPSGSLKPWGSHPDLDAAWSSSGVTVEHGELDVTRFDKITRIVESPTAMTYLRVCWENRDGRYNCERCFKCLRTRMGITFAGGECATLPSPLDPQAVKRVSLNSARRQRFRETIAELDRRGVHDPELVRAMKSAIRRSYVLQRFGR
ncbi:hypothetical protein [Gordonia alkanivorans]|nr:hypothetical protein [Gordonia alkanivorans]